MPEKSTDPFRQELARRIAQHAGCELAEIELLLERPPQEALGDYAFPCFALAKSLRKSPAVVAGEIAGALGEKAPFRSVAAKGPYVNVTVEPAELAAAALGKAFQEKDRYGSSDLGGGQTVVIDYSSPNIAKPFSIGHLRSTVIGQALMRILQFVGYRTVGVNHLGDWGTQFGIEIAAFRRWGSQRELDDGGVSYLNELYVRFHEEAEKSASLREEAKQWFRRLEQGDPEARKFWERAREISLGEFERIYERLGVRFDSVAGESFYNDKIDSTLREVEGKGLATQSEGATIIELEPYGMPAFLLRKSDDATLYSTRDLTAVLYRHRTYGARKILYVVGSDQRLHFRQLFKVLELLGHDWAKECAHVDFGLVRFKTEEGREKMSTRRGRVVLLEEVLDRAIVLVREILAGREIEAEEKERVARSVGIGAIIFHDLKNRRIKDIDFDWEQILHYDPETKSFRGETGPYLQYMHARLSSVLRKHDREPEPAVNWARLADPQEAGLVRMVYRFPQVVEDAAAAYEPSFISQHLLEVGSRFSTYYADRERHKILSEDEELTKARVLLTLGLRTVLANGLRLLGIEPLKRM